ncbi:tryptophan 7-halogenase [Saccharophagus degradans]|uniref:tryptophan halogenase family protein n=1 Tax=Saccharophagus degradans TaxID=86304 RepID=UPI002477DDAF|nr:tryptophan halogenase family protein [Saccharophagus degradans]WGO97985.1 tryptophan 7-halogenase [Saccharophagus degradans]
MIKKIVIVGGGTAGWMSAAILKKVLADNVSIQLIESDSIAPVGVGEATIPPIQHVNRVLGLDEAEFLRETKATLKLAIRFENWRVPGESYFHTFGAPGKSIAFCHFHHLWLRAQKQGLAEDMWQYDLNYLAAKENKFAKINTQDPNLEMPYAYHFDATAYAAYLRKKSEQMGVTRTEGLINKATINPHTGDIDSVALDNGEVIEGDLFIDCSGFRGLLIQRHLNTGYEDWSHWLPCDRAIAVPSERLEQTLPYTRSIAHAGGWQWRIPLQHRNGNGLVYSSAHYSEDEATHVLMSNLDSKPLAEPRVIAFKTGRARKQWNKNVIAVGLASGFIEPLESTSIHLIQAAIVRLLKLFPHDGINAADRDEFNKQSQTEYEQIRDFIILHYHVNQREDDIFWRQLKDMDIPASLAHKIELFKAKGTIVREQEDLFAEASWLQVMMGQGITPNDYHPIANNLPQHQLEDWLKAVQQAKAAPVANMPSHDDFIAMFCGTK